MGKFKFKIAFSVLSIMALPFCNARVITVTNPTDHAPGVVSSGNGLCLRDALAEARSGDTVTFNLPKDSNQTIVFTYEFPAIDYDMTVDGGSASNLTIEVVNPGESPFRLIEITNSAHVTFKNLKFIGGNVSTAGGEDSYGGTFYVKDGSLTLENVTVDGSKAVDGGGIYNSGNGTLTLKNCTISDNEAIANSDGGGNGGGICNKGAMVIEDSTIAENTAVDGGGVFLDSSSDPASGIVNIINSSTIAYNSAADGKSGGVSLQSGMFAMDDTILSDNRTGTGNKNVAGSVSFSMTGGSVLDLDDNIIQTPTTFTNAWTAKHDWLDTCGNGNFTQSNMSGCLYLDPAGLQKNGSSPNKTIAIKPPTNSVSIANSLYCTVNNKNFLSEQDLSDNHFGNSVSVSGDTEIVGDYMNEKAYIYAYDGVKWGMAQELTLPAPPSNNVQDSSFGNSVSISGDVAIVGDSDCNNGVGAAYIFRKNGAEWNQEAVLTAPGGLANGCFGSKVSISGNTAVVGALSNKGAGVKGKVYIYEYDTSAQESDWQLVKSLTSDTEGTDRYASSLQVSGNRLIVGDPGADDRGTVYIYSYNGTWSLDQTISSNAPVDFGISVSISGDVIAVGSIGTNAYGGVYVFRYDGAWKSDGLLISPDSNPRNAYFGASVSVSVSGNMILVGAPGTTVIGQTSAGAAYVFSCSQEGHNWSLVSPVSAVSLKVAARSNDCLGCSVSMSGDNILIGSSGSDSSTPANGKAYNCILWNGASATDERGVERTTDTSQKRTIGAYEYTG